MTDKPLELDPNRLFSSNPAEREIAARLYETVKDLPIISPHGHTDPEWFAENDNFPDPAHLFITPDHYVFRMLYSQGVKLEDLGVPRVDGGHTETDPRKIWRLFAEHYYLFRGTPSRGWLDYVFATVFDLKVRLTPETADHYYEVIDEQLKTDAFRPRALMDRFNIEKIATTEGATDTLPHHQKIKADGWLSRVVTTFRPDDVVDPEKKGFADALDRLGEITGEDISTWDGYLNALRNRRAYFKEHGATASDHGHPTATTANLSPAEAAALYDKVRTGKATPADAELFRGQMLTEMAGMSLEDGLTLQMHVGSHRNHNAQVFEKFGADKGADIPMQTDYVGALKPLLDRFGTEPDLTIILFTLDETVYSRELATLAGHYPCLRLGPPWWFHDSPEGMLRFRSQVTETAGFYNTVGFNDDTRAFLSIPARHDVARRMDCRYLAQLVAEGRLTEDEAFTVARELTYDLVKKAYKFD